MSRARVRFGEGRVWQCRIELLDVHPVVWRRVVVSDRAALLELHAVIEAAMGRDADGAFDFVIDGVTYTEDDAAALDLASLDVLPGVRVLHQSDRHAEPWVHVMTLERITPRLVGERLPACIGGERAAPPEACAGPAAYRTLLGAWSDPLDPRAADWRSWIPEDFDPGYADITAINAALARLPRRRPAA